MKIIILFSSCYRKIAYFLREPHTFGKYVTQHEIYVLKGSSRFTIAKPLSIIGLAKSETIKVAMSLK